MRRVLLTGATGNWGRATLRAFRERDDIAVTAFALPGAAEDRALAEFADMPHLRVVRGDLTDRDDVRRAIIGPDGAPVDVVLHVGAVVSPLADERPDLAYRVNVGSMANIIAIVKELPDPARVGVVGVGSVAETGDRQEPVHWGRVGDPIRVSRFDAYGQSKVAAERLLVDSGLPRWVWLRQTGILHSGVLAIRDPIVTHTPLAGVLEWVSDADSARLLVALSEADVPEEVWGQVFNVGGGEGWRHTNWDFHLATSAALGVPDVRGWFERHWFATRNFHGQWFTDSDRLDHLVPFRRDTFAGAVERVVAQAPASVRSAGRVPPAIVKHLVMRPLVHRPRGTMHAVRRRLADETAAWFGSHEEWRRIGDWDTFVAASPSRVPTTLERGIDEGLDPRRWTRDDLVGAARYRGGRLLSAELPDDGETRLATPLIWRCAEGHLFAASPRLVVAAGHWCPECTADSAGYERQAERNPFLAQLYRGPAHR